MRKLIESTFVTLDGVIADTDPSTTPRARPEKWGSPFWDDEHATYAHDLLFSSDALLLGRRTYEVFAQAWPSRKGELADRINSMPKYVPSRTLAGPMTWNAQVINGNVVEELVRLKEQPGQNILKYGTGVLDRTLLEHAVVDEFHFWIFPVAVGGGQHLFEGMEGVRLKLLRSTPFASGIVVHTYEPDRGARPAR